MADELLVTVTLAFDMVSEVESPHTEIAIATPTSTIAALMRPCLSECILSPVPSPGLKQPKVIFGAVPRG